MSDKTLELLVGSEDLEALHHLSRTILNREGTGVDTADAVELARLVENALEEPPR